MVVAEPEESVADEKTLDLLSAIIEDVTVPIFVDAFPRIRVFVKMSAVEVSERPFIRGKV